jgi:hypothetical protein
MKATNSYNNLLAGDRYCYLTIPGDSKILDIRLIETAMGYQPTQALDYYVLCRFDDYQSRKMLLQAIEDIKSEAEAYYKQSPSNGWVPTREEEVYWVTADYQSYIKKLHVKHDSNVAIQAETKVNYFKTKEEAEGLRDLIVNLLKERGLL